MLYLPTDNVLAIRGGLKSLRLGHWEPRVAHKPNHDDETAASLKGTCRTGAARLGPIQGARLTNPRAAEARSWRDRIALYIWGGHPLVLLAETVACSRATFRSGVGKETGHGD
jgi:hypothetical protein